mgnify:CR=1 FL=1
MRHYRISLGDKFSEGARLLWIAMGDVAPADFERSLGWSRGTLSNYLYGERRAGRDAAVLLFERHQIPIGAWAEKPTETFIPPAAREPEEEPSEGAA